MKHLLALVVLACLTLSHAWTQPASMYVPGQLFLKLRAEVDWTISPFKKGEPVSTCPQEPSLQGILESFGVVSLHRPFRTPAAPLQRIYQIQTTQPENATALIEALQALPSIEYAEQVARHEMHYTPDDYSPVSWQLSKIQALNAWDLCQGNRTVVVAIVDDAVRLDHQDLAAQIWTNPLEIPGDSIDNDGNGWIDDIHGYDLAEDDNDPSPPSGANNNAFSHGTHVAGIAAAATDNNIGVASIGFNLSILPCKVKLDSTINDPELHYTYHGVDYAISTGADVVNMSFGGPGYNATFAYLLSVGRDSGMVFIASAGNTGSYSVQYPAGYPDAVSVASTNSSDALSGFSTYHFSVDVSAPGSNIYSSTAGSPSSYGFKSGTSMSAPLVTGLVGLMKAADTTATHAQLRHCLESTTDNIDAQNPTRIGNFGTGRVNAVRALECLLFPVATLDELPNGIVLNAPVPNPHRDHVRVGAFLPVPGHLRLHLRDLGGRELQNWDVEVDAGEFSYQMNAPLPAGMYLLVWELEGMRAVQRIQVTR